jgi:hypothetical protein
MAAWIAAGRRDVARDRMNSAIELSFGAYPEVELLFAHIEDGRYGTVMVTGVYLRPDRTTLGAFGARLRSAVEAHYEVVGPPGVSQVDATLGSSVFADADRRGDGYRRQKEKRRTPTGGSRRIAVTRRMARRRAHSSGRLSVMFGAMLRT